MWVGRYACVSDCGNVKHRVCTGDAVGESIFADTQEEVPYELVATSKCECLELTREAFVAALEAAKLEQSTRHIAVANSASTSNGAGGAGAGAASGSDSHPDDVQISGLDDFEVLSVLGAGAFGTVKLVKHIPVGSDCPVVLVGEGWPHLKLLSLRACVQTGTAMALKLLPKARVVEMRQTENVANERRLLAMCRHPFVVRLFGTFQDASCLYMVTELLLGGELFSLLEEQEAGTWVVGVCVGKCDECSGTVCWLLVVCGLRRVPASRHGQVLLCVRHLGACVHAHPSCGVP